jgi:hypothetical protein
VNYGPELLLVAAVATVGVLHTMVPDHWVPIILIARQRGWSKSKTARAALQAGIGHVLSTLLIALVVWLAGAAFAQRFGHIVDTVSSLALIAFGSWFAISAWRDLRKQGGHGHSHIHDFLHLHGSEHGQTVMYMTTASTVTMNTTTRRRRRMIRFMRLYAVKRLSSHAMFMHTAMVEGLSIGTGMITRRLRPTQSRPKSKRRRRRTTTVTRLQRVPRCS